MCLDWNRNELRLTKRMDAEADIAQVISIWAAKTKVRGKSGKRQLQPTLAIALREAGFAADEEDQGQILRPGMPVWRSKEDQTIEPTTGRRRVDIVVHRDTTPLALIETESDLNDLRSSGVTRRNGHYDVWSIARTASGAYFDSYKSLERMAAAAFYWHLFQKKGRYPSVSEATQSLEALRSNERREHNPGNLPLFLISGSCRAQDKIILGPRLQCLGAELVCVSVN
jgi:hypothetical protein